MRSLERMHIGQKLAVLGGLVTLLFLVPTLLLLSRADGELERTRRALAGLDRALGIAALQRSVADHGAAAAALLAGDGSAAAAREASRLEADQRFTAATAATTDGVAESSRRLAAAGTAWKGLAEATAGRVISSLDSYQRHGEVLAQLQDALEAVLDDHALSADADMRVQRSVATAFREAPRLGEAMGRARALSMELLATREAHAERKQAVSAAVEAARARMAALAAQVNRMLQRDASLRGTLEAGLQALDAEFARAVHATRVDVIFSGTLDSGSARYHAAMGALSQAHGRFVGDLAAGARRILEERAAGQQAEIRFGVLATILALAVAVALAWWMARSIVRPLAFAVRVADGIAAGQLDHAIDPRRARSREAASLLAAFGSMQAGLSQLARDIQDTSREIRSAASQVAVGNGELSSRTEQQASSLEETAATMEELTATVGSNAEGARRAAEVVARAGEAAMRGAEAVGEAVRTMERIDAASKRIVDIVGVIDTIAFQTNILALNAAVEAARAGEQGRGFAVVASEVRNLAQRAGASAREIKALVRDSTGATEQGTLRVAESGRAMDDIMEAVQQVARIFTEISSASAEQGHGIQQVNHAIAQMDRVTQENAALVNEAAASSRSLQEQAARLAVMVERFRVAAREDARSGARPADPEAAPRLARPAPAEGVPRLSVAE